MNIDVIRDFLSFAESLSFTRAAVDRETTQSNLSKRLRKLELWLASDLIDRRSRPVALTQAGKDFVPVARSILAELATFRSNHRPWQVADGAITIAMPHSATISVFPSFKHQLAKKAISASFSVRIANHDSVGSILANSECDLALATDHPKVPQSPEFSALRSIEIAKERLVVVSSPELGDRKPAPLHVSDRRTYIGQIWQRCRISIPSTIELEHDMAADIRNYCLSGDGRGVVPLSLVEADINSGRLRNVGSGPNLAYTFLLYCAPKASMQARRIWSSAASIFSAT